MELIIQLKLVKENQYKESLKSLKSLRSKKSKIPTKKNVE